MNIYSCRLDTTPYLCLNFITNTAVEEECRLALLC